MRRAIATVPIVSSPQMAEALRHRANQIIEQWRTESTQAIPQLHRLTQREIEDDMPEIIEAIARAVESDDRQRLESVFVQPRSHGIERYIQNYGLSDLFMEARLFRKAVIEQVEDELGRPCSSSESMLLHSVIDIIFQQSVIALVERQNEEIRRISELQLKFLAYFSHDLNNQFLVITLQLEHLRKDLETMADGDNERISSKGVEPAGGFFASIAQRLNDALDTIHQTRTGMRRMLDHERLRVTGNAERTRVDLRELVESQARRMTESAGKKAITIEVDVPKDCEVETDPAIATILLQNLLDNAIKHSDGGTVRITAEPCSESAQSARDAGKHPSYRISITDEGPGISPEKQEQIFEALDRGDALGTPGMGLGLVIASQAARLLSTRIELESQPGAGSTFSFTLHG